jgi:hypothetical protein
LSRIFSQSRFGFAFAVILLPTIGDRPSAGTDQGKIFEGGPQRPDFSGFL